MCSIFGALLPKTNNTHDTIKAGVDLRLIMEHSMARGRDGYGWNNHFFLFQKGADDCRKVARTFTLDEIVQPDFETTVHGAAIIGNFRAEPTTEYVMKKRAHDQQPYRLMKWATVHNGTVANDRELRTHEVQTSIDSAAIVESLCKQPQLFEGPDDLYSTFHNTVKKVVGSYAILATHMDFPNQVLLAANYRPIWVSINAHGVFFASAEEYFPDDHTPIAIEPYSTASFRYTDEGHLEFETNTLRPKRDPNVKPRALVVASGGLDSTVAAAQCIKDGYDVELIHFTYGCRAEGREVHAVRKIGQEMGVPVTVFPMEIYEPSDSRLFDRNSDIAGGEEGAEFAHEWVPARNLVMLSVATAIAEARGFEYIVLGNNLEEAGAYPDNEPEFIRRFNNLLPFAVGDGKRVEVLMPVGDLMKHEIVALGSTNGAPLHLTWSCYKNGGLHCGKCGPCFMRKTAFNINGLEEVIQYEE